MLLMIDNYDCFTYNLVQYLGELGADVRVLPQRRDHARRDRGAGSPSASSSRRARARRTRRASRVPLIQRFAGEIPILGVCLGHQAIGQAFGGRIVRAQRVMHGKLSPVTHDGRGVFAGLPVAVHRHALPFARDRARERARRARSHGATGRRRDHGRAAPRACRRRRAVPSRSDPDRARPRAAANFLKLALNTEERPCRSPCRKRCNARSSIARSSTTRCWRSCARS